MDEQQQSQHYEGASNYDEQPTEFILQQIDVEKDLDRFTKEVLQGLVQIDDIKNWRKKMGYLLQRERILQ